jgi:crotonobetainyl-CoA:carnitine CoA-transferase CaiB-like acyl-CoA transferase
MGPFYHDIPDKNKSLYFFANNTNKKSVTLNLETKDGQGIFKRAVKTADFVIESFAPGFLDKLGLNYSALNLIKPDIILVSITAFGQTGPYKDWKASDLVSTAMGGLSYITGSMDRPPVRVSIDQAHVLAGAHAALGAMIAHYYRQATGIGQHVDVSMQECCVPSALTVPQTWDLQRIIWPRAGACLPRSGKKVRCFWPCEDGYITWRLFGGGLGVKTRALVDWMKSEGEAGELDDVNWQQMDYLTADPIQFDRWQNLFGNFFKKRTKEELCKQALARGIVLFAASTPKDLLTDSQLQDRDYWIEVEHPELRDTIIYPGALYKSTEISWGTSRAPLIGEHNNEIYEKELGFSRQILIALKQAGVI